MNERLLGQREPATTTAPPVWNNRLQRKCACGKTANTKGECDDCRKNRLQGKAQNSKEWLNRHGTSMRLHTP
jgi:hypothetical protein